LTALHTPAHTRSHHAAFDRLRILVLLRHKLLKPSKDAPLCVTRGLDPQVHLLRKKMDCRVKPRHGVDFVTR
jgi:hypothetical protein